jgi:hypothetical protein
VFIDSIVRRARTKKAHSHADVDPARQQGAIRDSSRDSRFGDGSLETHGVMYLWNQSSAEDNKMPAWDKLKVPALPTVP